MDSSDTDLAWKAVDEDSGWDERWTEKRTLKVP
jgi:hypothetical protein